MRYFKGIVEYDGTNYSGWQRQKNTPLTVQQKLEEALQVITKEPISLLAASRTDAGVHAYGQVIGFQMVNKIPTDRIAVALNSLLPKDIRIQKVVEVDADFHPRFHTVGKIYHYLIDNGPVQSAFRYQHAYHVPYELDVESMREASQYLIGTHDFSSFRASGCSAKSPVRTIKGIDVAKTDHLIRLSFEGDGFLYNMVRILTGNLVYVGLGKFKPRQLKDILQAKDRTMGGPTAPPHGLYLVKVFY